MNRITDQVADAEWVTFPGGELEGKRPRALCPSCRGQLPGRAASLAAGQSRRTESKERTVCFQCYRAEVDRERAFKAAGHLNTASIERFQSALPFEPVNQPRLEMLRAERASARTAMHQGVARFDHRRRQAQLAARHALQGIIGSHVARQVSPLGNNDRKREVASAIHAAELQLPESWIPFVVSR